MDDLERLDKLKFKKRLFGGLYVVGAILLFVFVVPTTPVNPVWGIAGAFLGSIVGTLGVMKFIKADKLTIDDIDY